jgi:hypothetical protein
MKEEETMPSRSQLAVLLADRINRLRGAFAALHRSVRERVAEIVGATVADVVRQTVQYALEPPAPQTPIARVARRDGYYPWGGPEADDGAADRDLIDDERCDAWGYPAPVARAMPPRLPAPPPEPPVLPRLAVAAVVGLKAAAWWLATSRLRRGWCCVVAGVLAGGAAYVLGPVALTVTPAATALSLAARSAELVHAWPA